MKKKKKNRKDLKKSVEMYQNLSEKEKNKKQEYGRKIEKCITQCEKVRIIF